MEVAEYKKMFDQEDRHWWFQGRYELVKRVLERHAPKPEGRPLDMLDIGCGTGLFLQRWGAGKNAVGLDFSREGLKFTRTRGLSRLVCGDAQKIPFAAERFDLVTAFDLVEHVDRDGDLVAEVHRVLRPGGVFMATVPAHPFLWSQHDVALHHKRRYVYKQFNALFDPAKWNRKRFTFAFATIFPAAAVVRTIAGKPKQNGHGPAKEQADTNRATAGWLNNALIGWHKVEASWIERFNAPFGLSLMTVQEKK